MSAQTGNLKPCPVCDSNSESQTGKCERCGYGEIGEGDFLDEEEQARHRQRFDYYCAAWVGLENSLRKHLRELGSDWDGPKHWKEIWAQVQTRAAQIHFNERRTFRETQRLWKQLQDELQDEPQDEPPINKKGNENETSQTTSVVDPETLERVRRWVADLPDGEVNVRAWMDFLDSFDDTVDTFFLEAFRDEELARQFNSFETVVIDAGGNLNERGQGKVKQFVEKLGDGVELVMLKVAGGRFQMGAERYSFEQPVHTVNVPDFYLGKHPVTQAQWRAVAGLPKISIEIGGDDSRFKGDDLPAECVSWVEAEEFCARLSKQTGRRYRLPSEAEWEYACRAGSSSPFAFGQTLIPSVTNYDGNHPYGNAPHGIFRGQTVAAGVLGIANNFGLCDMHGNVCEWCADEWHDTYEGAPTDGSAWLSNDNPAYRVIRGGSWVHTAEVCRSSDRNRESPDVGVKLYYLGFRVALDL